MAKKRSRIFGLLTAGLLMASLVGCGSNTPTASNKNGDNGSSQSSGGGNARVTIKIAFPSGKGSMLYEAAYMYADLVKEKSKGQIEVKNFSDGQLGKDLAVLDAMKTGSIQMSIPSTVLAQKSPEFGVFDIPFLFADRTKVEKLAKSDIWNKDLKGLLPQHGLVGLGFWENGFRQITNTKKPIQEPDDLKGIKIRVPESKIRVEMFKVLGANPTPMDFSEVFSALQQGVIDGQENPLPTIVGGKFEEVQKYLSITNHTYTPAYLVASKVWWDKLSPEDQKLLQEAADEVADKIRKKGEEEDNKLVDYFKSKGLKVNNANIKAFQQKTSSVVDLLKDKVDPKFIEKVVKAAE